MSIYSSTESIPDLILDDIYIYICLQKFELFLVPGMLITDIFILDRNHVKVSLLITYSIRCNCFPFHFLMLML